MSNSFWNNRNVFAIGCAGLLGFGSNKSFVDRRANVIGLAGNYVPHLNLDLFHLAAHTIGTIANRNPISTFKSNIDGIWNRSAPDNKMPIIRSDGTFLRDYFHIEDGIESYLLLAEMMGGKRLHRESFNFSAGCPVSVLEIVNTVLAAMGSPLESIILNETANEISDQYLSAEKARRVLGWRPLYTLEEGVVDDTVAW